MYTYMFILLLLDKGIGEMGMMLGWNGEKEVERRRRGGSRERDMGMVLGWNGEKEEKREDTEEVGERDGEIHIYREASRLAQSDTTSRRH